MAKSKEIDHFSFDHSLPSPSNPFKCFSVDQYLTGFVAPRFLSYVDLKGVTYSSATIATGFGAHLAQPLLRSHVEGREDQLTEQEALAIMEMCMKVLFYRDARSINKVRVSFIIRSDLVFDQFAHSFSIKSQRSRMPESQFRTRAV